MRDSGRSAGFRSPLGRLAESPVGGAGGLLWPWITPWAIAGARWDGSSVHLPAGGTPLRVLSANALGSNRRAAEWARTAGAIEADVLVVVEASTRILDALDAIPLADHYPWSFEERRPRWAGCGIWSRYPARLLEAGDAGYAYIAVELDLPGGRSCSVVALHMVAPATPGSGPRWVASFESLAEIVSRLPRPVIAAGDYNATLGHRPLRRLVARTGMVDAHTAVGRGLARTWPDHRWLPSVALIDRVLVTEDVRPVAVTERSLPGSDHRAVIADLVLADQPG